MEDNRKNVTDLSVSVICLVRMAYGCPKKDIAKALMYSALEVSQRQIEMLEALQRKDFPE